MRSYDAFVMALAVLAAFLYAAYEIQTGWSPRSRLFALTITVPAIALALAQAARELRRLGVARAVPAEANVGRSAIAWFAAFFASLWLVGVMTTIPLYSAAYLRFAAGEAWPKAVAYALAAWAFAYVLFVVLLHIPLPTGVLTLPAVVP